MARYEVDSLRDIVLTGHGAVGKTTLADRMLYKSGKNNRAGSTDDGTSLLDTDDDERERKHSVTAHLAHFDHDGHHINVVDAPGYPDFIGQAIGAVDAVETTVIVISASAGIEAGTRRAFQLAEQAGKARLIVINKCDAESTDLPQLINHLQELFGTHCAMLNVPNATGAGFSSVLPLDRALPAGDLTSVFDPVQARQELLDAAVEADEALMEKYLSGHELEEHEVRRMIRQSISDRLLVPILFMSARKDVGVTEFMDVVAQYAPGPCVLSCTQNGELVDLPPDPQGPLVARVFKTRIDPFVSRMSYARVYSGTIRKDAILKNSRTGSPVKAHQMLDVQGNQYEAVSEVGPGELFVIVKADDLRTGDLLTCGVEGLTVPPVTFPVPMISLAVEPQSQSDQQKISGALHKIEDEDPTFTVSREAQTHELVMHGMSDLHLQLIQNRLNQREKVKIVVHPPRVPYHETVTIPAEGAYRHKKQSGGAGQFAEVHLRISPCPQGIDPEEYFTSDIFPGMRSYHYDPTSNFCFIDRVSGGSIPNQYIPAVEKGVREQLEQGVLAGYPVQDVVVELFFGKDHPVDSNENAFRTAARMCFREVFRKARPVLLEPIVHLDVTVPATRLGDITSDLNSRRGRMEGMDAVPGGMSLVKANAPLAEISSYARTLSSLTGGQGSYTLEFDHYEPLPAHEQQKVVAASQVQNDD